MKRVIKYMDGHRMMFSVAIIAIVIATIMQLATPIIIKYAVDSVIGDEPAGNMTFVQTFFGSGLMGVVWLFVVVNLIRGVFLFIKGYYSNVAAEKIAENVRKSYKIITFKNIVFSFFVFQLNHLN